MSSSTDDQPVTVVVVTADTEFATACEQHLSQQPGVQVTLVSTVGAAVDRLTGSESIDCIISDNDLPDIDGIAFLEVVRAQAPTLPFILFTSEGSEEVASRAISADVTEYFIKEHHADQWERLTRLIDDAVAYYHAHGDIVNGESRAKTLLDAAHDMIAVVSDNHFEYINQAGLELLGADDRSAVIDRPVRQILTTEDDTAITDRLTAVETGEQSLNQTEARLTCDDGLIVPVELTATYIEWMDAPAAILVVREISKRKDSEQALQRFRRAAEAAGHAIYITDSNGIIEYVNPAFEDITGYSSDEAVGQTPRILKSGEMPDEYYENLWTTITDGNVWEAELQNRRKSGELYYAWQTIAPVIADDGSVSAFVAIQTDITEQKERENRLRQYERAINSSNELITAVDNDYRYLFANPAYREFHDLESEILTDMTLQDALSQETFESVEPYIEQTLKGNSVQYRMTRTRPNRPDGTFEIQYHPLENDTGEIYGGVATMRDITAQVEWEQHLATLDRILRHTLRNELNVIQSRAELIIAQASGDVASNAETIVEIGNCILTQAEKEREVIELFTNISDPAPQNLVDLITDIVAQTETNYPEVEMTLDVPESVEVMTIPEIKRAIEEVIENAISHSDQETPEITIRLEERDEMIELSVADTGPGIPSMEQKRLTNETVVEPLLHSSGMGLWLVKHILNRIGGTVQVEEATPRGSVVTLVIPRDGMVSARQAKNRSRTTGGAQR